MNDSQILLKVSNQLYREMIQCLDILNQSPKAAMDPQSGCRMDRFRSLQSQIEDNDSRITQFLPTIGRDNDITNHLLSEREALLKHLLNQNKLVTSKAASLKSLLRDELQKSSKGHTALQGYRQSDQVRNNGVFKKTL
ncbi:hypothetical protein [Desulfosediminicola flagellatus]|uniref:hypothetical protein n=1 Tax=Desulfosediminicola flagellatus TaxID=2569541 RepID=UPI0010AB88B3|nr:hypothetical protein [Desulfosediminicola flagellatus]